VEQITIVITESAYTDLEDIENYISLDSPSIARSFISKIFDKIDYLYQYPSFGKPVPELGNKSIRELLLNNIESYTRLLTKEISVSLELYMVRGCLIWSFKPSFLSSGIKLYV